MRANVRAGSDYPLYGKSLFMGEDARDVLLARTFVELVDTLVDEFDVVDLLTLLTDRCVEVLEVAAVGLMLVVPEGGPQVVA